jgi:hypothetical protein
MRAVFDSIENTGKNESCSLDNKPYNELYIQYIHMEET